MSLEATAWVMSHSPHRGDHTRFVIHLYLSDGAARMDGRTMEVVIDPAKIAERAAVHVALVELFIEEASREGLLRRLPDGGSYVKVGGVLHEGEEMYEFLLPMGVAA